STPEPLPARRSVRTGASPCVLPDSRPDLRDQPRHKPGNANTRPAQFPPLGPRGVLASAEVAHPRHEVGDHLDGYVELLGVGHLTRLAAPRAAGPRPGHGAVADPVVPAGLQGRDPVAAAFLELLQPLVGGTELLPGARHDTGGGEVSPDPVPTVLRRAE